MQSREFPFSPNFNFGVNELYSLKNSPYKEPVPPTENDFLLLDNTNFLLLDNTNFLLLA